MDETSHQNTGALSGIRVIDLTRVLGGPYGTQILADHGADVVKVEPPQGDEVRDWGPPFRDGTASYFVGINRNKRMIALDLGQEAGREVLLRLLETADVMIHNYKSGALEKWGIGYEEVLRDRFPRLVYCHLTGYGSDGPLGGLPGYDSAVQATAGMMSVNGPAETGPLRIAVPIVDLGMGLNAVIGILLALLHRDRTGAGQAVDVSLYDAAVSLLHPQAANYLMSGKVPEATGNAHPNISPYERFDTGTKPIFLAVGNDRQFRTMCELMGVPGLSDDPRFVDNASRVVNRDELRAELKVLFQGRDGEELADALISRGRARWCGARRRRGSRERARAVPRSRRRRRSLPRHRIPGEAVRLGGSVAVGAETFQRRRPERSARSGLLRSGGRGAPGGRSLAGRASPVHLSFVRESERLRNQLVGAPPRLVLVRDSHDHHLTPHRTQRRSRSSSPRTVTGEPTRRAALRVPAFGAPGPARKRSARSTGGTGMSCPRRSSVIAM